MPLKPSKVIGHRGNRRETGYENTLGAFAHALDHAGGLETDAVLSADGEIFLIHDIYYTGESAYYELDGRLDGASRNLARGRRIDEMPAADVARLRLVEGDKIPTLAEALEISAKSENALFDLELKGAGTALPVVKTLQKAQQNGQSLPDILITSFNHPELQIVRDNMPECKIGMLYEPSNTKGCAMYPWLPEENTAFFTPFALDCLTSPEALALRPDYFCLNEYDLRPDVLSAIRKHHPQAGVYIWWWYEETPPAQNERLVQTMRQLERAGLLDMLTGIITDYPAEMQKTLHKEFPGE